MSLHAGSLWANPFCKPKISDLFQPPLNWNFQRMLDAAIAELPTKPDAIQHEIIQALKDIAAHHNLDSSNIPGAPSTSFSVPRSSEVSVTSHGATFHIETRSFKIESILEATRFYGLLQRVTGCLIETHACTETRAGDAEARAEEARARAEEAQVRAEEARVRAEEAQVRAEEAQACVATAETQAAEARSLKAIAEAAHAAAEADLAGAAGQQIVARDGAAQSHRRIGKGTTGRCLGRERIV